jgi:hypothetical protein
MRLTRAALLVISVVVALTVQGASAASSLTGTATRCTGFTSCVYTITSAAGTGRASTSGNTITLQLPGEPTASYGNYSMPIIPNSQGTFHLTGSFTLVDANTGKVVFGSTDVTLTVTVFCRRGCSTTYSLVSGNITLNLTDQDGTTTSVVCNPGSFLAGQATTCTAAVSDVSNASNSPTGTVSFTSSYGSLSGFSNGGMCTLNAGRCSIQFGHLDELVGAVPIFATYGGDAASYTSSGRTLVYISSNDN